MNLADAHIEDGVVHFGPYSIPLPANRVLNQYAGKRLVLGIRPHDLEDADVWRPRPADHRGARGRDRGARLGGPRHLHGGHAPRRHGGDDGRRERRGRGAHVHRGGREPLLRAGRCADALASRRLDPALHRSGAVPLLRSAERHRDRDLRRHPRPPAADSGGTVARDALGVGVERDPALDRRPAADGARDAAPATGDLGALDHRREPEMPGLRVSPAGRCRTLGRRRGPEA